MNPSESRQNESGTGPRAYECEVEPHRETVLIRPIGELDMSTVDQFAATLREITTAGFDRVVLDLRELTFMDSSGLRALLEVQSIAAPRSSLQIIPGPEPVQRIFQATGLVDRLPFVGAADALR